MKRTFFLTILILLLSIYARAQYVNIPDSGFRVMLKQLYPACFNAMGQMDTTCSGILDARNLEIFASATVWVPTWHTVNINSLEGLQYLKNLETLEIQANSVSFIPSFPSTLKVLNFHEGYRLSSLPALPPGLQILYLTDNGINVLPELPTGLQYFKCGNNALLNNLPALPASIEDLVITNNVSLISLPALPAQLRNLECSGNFSSIPDLPEFLRRFRCRSGSILNLPELPASLTYLNVNSNSILSLPSLPVVLDTLEIAGTRLTSLPMLPDNLRFLNCSYNEFLTTIQNLPPNLKKLDCSNIRYDSNYEPYGFGQLTNLPALPNSLTFLNCSGNRIQYLSQIPPNMDTLWCAHNRLTALPAALNGVLKVLYCDSNFLSAIPVLPKTTREIYCKKNNIQYIASLPDSLKHFDCRYNTISELPPLPTGILTIHCFSNNIYCFPKIPNNPTGQELSIYFDVAKIKCMPNYPSQRVSSYGFSPLTLPLCNPTNNISHCSAFPVISGTVFYDMNANGVKDSGEPAKANTRITLSNNNYTITDNNGRYEIGAPDTGRYTISVTAPTYYDAVPSSIQYRFITYDTLVTVNFPLQANTIKDSASITINPGNWAARPGFAYSYVVNYENTGTTTLSPTLVVDYDETRLTYDSSSIPSVVNNGGTLSLPVSNFLPGQRRSFIAYFRIKTTVLRGDSLQATATIINGNMLAKKSFAMIIGGSFDPNDKQGTPALTPTQVANGEYIDYTIRFQNTGTDTAFTVVISDTLSSDLQANTLELVNALHSCKATVKNNVVWFEFPNILLPDSNVNEPKSHGFVSFKIKPVSTIQVNSNINNKAAIYFDYNAPVITNTAVTAIRNPIIPLPLSLVSFTAARSTPNTASLEWNTANEFNSSQFIIQQSDDGRSFTNCANETAKNGQYNFYRRFVTIPTDPVYLRLKMLDIDGRFTYSPVVLLRKQGNKAPFTILNNPVHGMLNIEITDASLYNTTARIINAQGVVVKTVWLQKNVEELKMHVLAAGMYILQTLKGSERFIITQ